MAEGCGQSDPVWTRQRACAEHHPTWVDNHRGAGVERRTWTHEHDAHFERADGCSGPGAPAVGVGVEDVLK
jgi:hypothetical protein